MILIGDVHGKFNEYLRIIQDEESSIQLGDFGVGFPKYRPFNIPEQHRFIRGNHDNPDVCRQHPNYLGEFGYTDKDIFFVSGAYSIDKDWRIEGVSWWNDEELSYTQGQECIDLYKKIKPKIMVSHDCPESLCSSQFCEHKEMIKTRTGQFLQMMFEYHSPKLWVFGHYHTSFKKVIGGTEFVCLAELETIRI